MTVFSTAWAMPNKWTFQQPPIAAFVRRWIEGATIIVDPFCGQSRVERDALLARVEAAEKDAARYRWLTSDHDDPWVRQHCREILERMGVMSYSATSAAIDTALEIEQFHAIDAAMEGGK